MKTGNAASITALSVAFPEAHIPTFQLSLKRGLDPAEHLAIGEALAPLREQGVLIVGSGMSFHNMSACMGCDVLEASRRFDAWLEASCAGPPVKRATALNTHLMHVFAIRARIIFCAQQVRRVAVCSFATN